MEKQHPLTDLMGTAMGKIRTMVDANTIIGTPIQTGDVTLIPVSRLSFGIASGGSDFTTKNQKPEADNSFGGGSGAGVSITPIAFLVVTGTDVRLLQISSGDMTTIDRLVDMIPSVMDKVSAAANDMKKDKPAQPAPAADQITDPTAGI